MSTSINDISIIDNVVLIFILSVLLSLFHELGHASALKYYKGKPKEIGFGLYLLFPVFYCEVTDAWKLKIKERIVVNFGGIYFEMITVTCMLIYFILTSNMNILMISFYIFISLFYNLNPLIRTDGYWILSDATNTPNLMSVSTQRMNLFFKYLLRKEKCIFYKKDIFLISYAILSKTYILIIITLLFIYNKDSIINFIPNLYNIILNLDKVQVVTIQEIIIPFIFYLVSIKYIIKQIKNIINRIPKLKFAF